MTFRRHDLLLADAADARPLRLVRPGTPLDERTSRWAAAHDFTGKPGQLLVVPGEDGAPAEALVGVSDGFDPMAVRGLAGRLPAGDWRLDGLEPEAATLAAVAFGLGSYGFDRYRRRPERAPARLAAAGADLEEAERIIAACWLAREMIDTPAADLGPLQIETIAREIAEAHGAALTVTVGDALLQGNYPAVHAVGRAATAERAPRMIEIGWRLDHTDLPLVALVGKGVVFDTGGLNIKGGAGMRLMKKDMGGGAHALALGRLIMQAGLPVRLVVLVAAVENAISGDALRPGDVLATRKGLTVEVGNTDAEGRLILADALARAAEHAPDITIDYATLTGAARIALGPELPALYATSDELAAALLAAGTRVTDPLWRMPLWPGYAPAVEGDIADLRNDPAGWAQAGSVTAALFLKRFAPETGAWAHLDVMAWNPRKRPGWPEGAEAQGLRAAYAMLKARFGA